MACCRERWRSGDDVIYEVPGPHSALAHTVQPGELPIRDPVHGLDIEAFAAYRAAINDPSRKANFAWRTPNEIHVSGALAKGSVFSLQVPYHAGWKAMTEAGEDVPVKRDPVGFLYVTPACDGPCEVTLRFVGSTEAHVLSSLSIIAWAGLFIWLWRGRATVAPRPAAFLS
ncbi:MAG: hypothetical protein WDO18_15230 [Acidobacteriota bacterium]